MKLALINQKKLMAFDRDADLDQLNRLLDVMNEHSTFEDLKESRPDIFKIFWDKFKHFRRVDIFDEVQAQFYGYPSPEEFYSVAHVVLSVIKVDLMKVTKR